MITQTNPLKPKKIRKDKDGKPREREETDRERRDRYFAGSDDLKRLSLGIPESEDKEPACLIDDEINDEIEDDEEDCLIPLNWAKIASSNTATQDKMKQTIQEARDRQKKKKETKKNCQSGSPWHDKNGRFSSVENAKSWSIGNQDGVGRSDCKYGKKKKSGSGKSTAFTKRECGREDVTNPNDKAKYRCKDGSVVHEGETRSIKDVAQTINNAWQKTTSNSAMSEVGERLQLILDREPNFLTLLTFLLRPIVAIEKSFLKDNPNTMTNPNSAVLDDVVMEKNKGKTREEIRSMCAASGFFGWTDFLLKLSAIEQAKKGTINNQKK